MSKWVLVVLLVLQAHFAASYLVPLDGRSQGEFGGLLGWFWPWADDGDAKRDDGAERRAVGPRTYR